MSCICDSSVSGIVLSNGQCLICKKSSDPYFNGTVVNGKCACIKNWTFVATPTGGYCACTGNNYLGYDFFCLPCQDDENTTAFTDGRYGCLCKKNFIWRDGGCIC